MHLINQLLRLPDTDVPETEALRRELKGIRKQGFLTKSQAIKILRWKSPRPLQRYQQNTESSIREITSVAFSLRNERLRMHMLTAMHGVNIPAASAILMFYDSKRYPVIDIRVWRQLYYAGLVDTNPRGQGFTLDEWEKYLAVIRKIARENSLTPRLVEKRIFDIDKAGQTGKLYGSKAV